nr:type II toxin-antitoxin system VapC family toxin [Polymorphobacter sp.]
MIVLDASAVLAVLLDEPGADVVIAHLEAAVISTVNLSEVATRLRRGLDADVVRSHLNSLRMVAIPADETLAVEAGLLDRVTSPFGLSLGDRHCLALGLRLGCPVLTGDRAWSEVASAVGVEVRLIR